MRSNEKWPRCHHRFRETSTPSTCSGAWPLARNNSGNARRSRCRTTSTITSTWWIRIHPHTEGGDGRFSAQGKTPSGRYSEMKHDATVQRLCLLPHSILFLAWSLLLLPPSLPAGSPPALPIVRAIVLPAEVLLTWDGPPDATYYGIYRADLDRRWMPIAKPVLAPRYRDTDFRTLPCYYQVAAFNGAGELIAFSEFLVSNTVASVSLYGVDPRPVSDTSVALVWNMMGSGDGLLEIGTDPTNYLSVATATNFASRQEFIL